MDLRTIAVAHGNRRLVVARRFLPSFPCFTDLDVRPQSFRKLFGAIVVLLASFPVSAVTPTAAVGTTSGSLAVGASGAASYTVPIAIAPGTNGMQPSLTLSYSSQAGNGLLGQGGALGGFSIIHRCGATIAIDGAKGGVNYNAGDRFCLDGERLIAIGGAEYRTQHESWQKVTAVGGTAADPSYFTVTGTDGTVHYYGATADSRIEAQGKSAARLWALNKTRDRHGNYLTVTYQEDNASGDYRPTSIAYTGNDVAVVTPYNSVVFAYETRSDSDPDYLGGSLINLTHRLKTVTAYSGATSVRRYDVYYDNAGYAGRSRITSVSECGSDSVCLPATTFTWQAGSGNNGFAALANWGGAGNYLADVNGDGRADLLSASNGGVTVALSNGNNFGAASNWASFNFCFDPENGGSCRFSFGDANGDGKDDLLVSASGGPAYVGLSTGSSFGSLVSRNGNYFADVNGDGRADLINISTNGFTVSLSAGSSFGPASNWAPSSINSCYDAENGWVCRFAFGDVNGDGKADLVVNGSSVGLSTGSGFSTLVSWGAGGGNQHYLGDVNGDGRADLVAVHPSAVTVSLSTGLSFGAASTWTSFSNCYDAENNFWACSFAVGDVNGDGKADFSINGASIALSTTPTPDLITNITNGLGVATTVAYKKLKDSTVHTAGSDATYPYRNVRTEDITLVSSVGASNGIGGVATTAYLYGNLKKHVTAETNLGFHWMQTIDPAGLVHNTYFNQTLNGAEGSVTVSETWLGNTRLKYGSNTWTPANLTYGRTLALLTASYEETKELNGTLVTSTTSSTTHDSYGFPLTQTVTHHDNWRKTVTNTYTHDTANWLLGQLAQIQVTAEAPGQPAQTRTSGFTYGTNGLISHETIEPGNTALSLTTSYTYDAFGNRLSKAVSGGDIASRTESQTYDPTGRFVTSRTNAVGHSASFAYDSRGLLASQTDPNGLTTTFDYDGFGRNGLEVRPDGTQSTITYAATASGYQVRVQSTGTGDTYTYFDRLGREIQANIQGFGGNWIYKRTDYDALGRVSFKSRPEFSAPGSIGTVYGYDALGRATSVTEPGNRITTTAYDGLTTTVTNPLGQNKRVTTNSQGKPVTIIEAFGTAAAGTSSYQYDSAGNLLYVTDPLGNLTAMQYDLRGRKTAMQDPNMGSWTYGYNTLGELIRQTDAKGQITTMAYDVLGRLTTRTAAEGTSDWTYDTATYGLGKLARVASPDGYREKYYYDALGRVVELETLIAGQFFTIGTAYDSAGRVSRIIYPTGYKVEQIYDAYGHLFQVLRLKPDGTQSLLWQTDVADAQGRIIQETFGNGAVGQRLYQAQTGDLAVLITGSGGTNIRNLQDLAHTFDAIGNLKTRNDAIANFSETFGYDELNRVVSAATTPAGLPAISKSYQYNAIGNITYKSDVGTYTYNPSGASSVRPHAVTRVAGTLNHDYTYDANGNLLTGAGRTVTYTSFNKPATVTANGQTSTFQYDPSYNRIQKFTATQATLYLGKLYERVTTGTLVEHKHYVYGGRSLVAVYTQRNSNINDTKYFHTDHLDSVSVITDDNANVVERLSFDAHGKRRQTNGQDATAGITSSANRGFTRHEHDDEIGLINMNARLYDPVIGRFITSDTVVDGITGQGLNRYSYVRNNPLSLTDPTGNWSLRRHVKSLTRAMFKPSLKNTFKAVREMPGQRIIDRAVMSNKTLYAIGQWAATYFTFFCGGCGGAAYSAYYTYQATGSMSGVLKSAAISYVSSYVGGSFADGIGLTGGGFVATVARGAVTGGVSGGLSAAMTGQSVSSGFKNGALGGAIGASLTYAFSQTGTPQEPAKSSGPCMVAGSGWSCGASDQSLNEQQSANVFRISGYRDVDSVVMSEDAQGLATKMYFTAIEAHEGMSWVQRTFNAVAGGWQTGVSNIVRSLAVSTISQEARQYFRVGEYSSIEARYAGTGAGIVNTTAWKFTTPYNELERIR